jgi:predicted dinucleotide-binding enzyme
MESAQAAADRAGAVADTPYNDAAVCEMLIFAGPREKTDELLVQAGCISDHAVIVDAMEDAKAGDANGAELLARKLNTYRVVLAVIAAPEVGGTISYWGDDSDAMTKLEEVFRTAGCVTTYRGSLAQAAEMSAPAAGSTG